MGCSPTKIKQRREVYSESLPLTTTDQQILAPMARGMTINPKATPSYVKRAVHQEEYKRPTQDYDCKTAVIVIRKKSLQEFEEIQESITSHPLFRETYPEILISLIENMTYYVLKPNEIVFYQGEAGYNFFLIASGTVEVVSNNKRVVVLERGKSFGELALLHGSGRNATVKTLTNVRLWGLGREIFQELIQKGNQKQYFDNKEFLTNVPTLKALSSSQIEGLLCSLIVQTFETNEKILSMGENSAEFYIIKSGAVNLFKNNEKVITLGKGEYFGEQSIIRKKNQLISVIARCTTTLLCFTKDTLLKVFGQSLEMVLYLNTIRIAFAKHPLLSKLTFYQTNKILAEITIKELKEKENRPIGQELWVVIKGKITAVDGGIWETMSCVNAHELLGETLQDSEEVSCEKAVIGCISKEKLQACLETTLEHRLNCNEIVNGMKHVDSLRAFPQKKLEILSTQILEKHVAANEIVFSRGDNADCCYIIKSGKINIIRENNAVYPLGKGDHFGERAILFKEPRVGTAQAAEDSVLWIVSGDLFLSLIDEKLRKHIMKISIFQDCGISLENLELLQTLKKTESSTILLASHKQILLTLKCISRKFITSQNALPNYISTKEIHKNLSHPFIKTLVNTFKNSDYLYLLYEYIPGCSIRSLIRKQTVLSLKQAQFYASVVLLILEYLHSKSILHRKITSKNFFLDECGYPMLSSFSFAKIVPERTFSIVGSPYYLAPEIITGKGYTFHSDLWSLGVLIYEMLYRIMPFGHGEKDPFAIYEIILKENHRYPVFIKESMKPKGIIERLLDKTPGGRGTAESLKKHPWFDGVVWDELLAKEVVPETPPGIIDTLEKRNKGNKLDIAENKNDNWADGF